MSRTKVSSFPPLSVALMSKSEGLQASVERASSEGPGLVLLEAVS